METRAIKLLKILIKIAIMFLVMTGLILINKKFMNNADGSERWYREISSERLVTSEEILDAGVRLFYKQL